MLGLDEAFERFYRENPKGLSGAADRSEPKPKPTATPTASPTGARPTSELLPQSDDKATTTGTKPAAVIEAIDTIIEALWLEQDSAGRAVSGRSDLSKTWRTSGRFALNRCLRSRRERMRRARLRR